MKLRIVFLFSLVAVISAAAFGQAAPGKPEKLPTAREIVERHIKASGGRAAFEKVRTRISSGTIEMRPMGIKGTFEAIAAAPNLSLVKLSLAGIGDLLEGYDGTTAWSANPIQGSREKTGAELLQTKNLYDFYRDIRLDKIYPKMTVTGIEKVGGRDAYVVRAEPVGLNPDLLYFDVVSGLMIRMDSEIISPEGTQKTQAYYGDYKPFDGVMIATTMRTVLPQGEIIIALTDIKNNVQIDRTKFAKPKS